MMTPTEATTNLPYLGEALSTQTWGTRFGEYNLLIEHITDSRRYRVTLRLTDDTVIYETNVNSLPAAQETAARFHRYATNP